MISSQYLTISLKELRAAIANGTLIINSDLNRGHDGSCVWSEARQTAFRAAKLEGFPCQSLTFVRITPTTGPCTAAYSVLDGRNRLQSLLKGEPSVVDAITLSVEYLNVPIELAPRIPEMFVALNNGGIPLTPGEALLVSTAPPLRHPSTADILKFGRDVWELICSGRNGWEIDHDPHNPASVIAHSLWKIRDAIHGAGNHQGQPTLPESHSELFGPGGRREREQGFVTLIRLIGLIRHCGLTESMDIANVFGNAALNATNLGEKCAGVLAIGSKCTNHLDKAWLPNLAVMDLLLFQSLPQADASWWPYFKCFLERCHSDQTLWMKCILIDGIMPSAYREQFRVRHTHKLVAFARLNCVEQATVRMPKTPKVHTSYETPSTGATGHKIAQALVSEMVETALASRKATN